MAQTESDFRAALQEGATEMKETKESKLKAEKEASELRNALRKTLEKEGRQEALLSELSRLVKDQVLTCLHPSSVECEPLMLIATIDRKHKY